MGPGTSVSPLLILLSIVMVTDGWMDGDESSPSSSDGREEGGGGGGGHV